MVVFGLVAGLLVWAPWVTPPPGTPTAIATTSKTATSATVSWTAPQGGTAPDRYLVTRDGRQVGLVPVGQTSYTDNGLAPGSTHYYTITAASGTLRSTATARAKVVTMTPPRSSWAPAGRPGRR